MLYNFDDSTVRCPSCGGIRFWLRQTFEANKDVSGSASDVYKLHHGHDELVCTECGSVVCSNNNEFTAEYYVKRK